jgi:hypothetical protein
MLTENVNPMVILDILRMARLIIILQLIDEFHYQRYVNISKYNEYLNILIPTGNVCLFKLINVQKTIHKAISVIK